MLQRIYGIAFPKASELQEHLQLLEEAKQRAQQTQQSQTTTTNVTFKNGDRVFHSQYGIGHITDVKTVAGTTLYIIDFGKFGQKSFDSTLANLKKF